MTEDESLKLAERASLLQEIKPILKDYDKAIMMATLAEFLISALAEDLGLPRRMAAMHLMSMIANVELRDE